MSREAFRATRMLTAAGNKTYGILKRTSHRIHLPTRVVQTVADLTFWVDRLDAESSVFQAVERMITLTGEFDD